MLHQRVIYWSVVRPLGEGLAGDVVLAGDFGARGGEVGVVRSIGRGVDPPGWQDQTRLVLSAADRMDELLARLGWLTFYPREDDRVRHGQLDDQVESLVAQQGVEQLGLGGLAREAVEDEVVILELEQPGCDQLQDSFIWEEPCEA